MRGPRATIYLDRLKSNFDIISKHLVDKKIMAVVKANGYGHGSIACAQSLENIGCDFFAVFSLEEGIALRNGNIKSDILVFSCLDSSRLQEAIDYNLILNISDKSHLEEILLFYQKTGSVPRTHLKIDTGMTRLGIEMESVEIVIKKLIEYPEINCEGIYSHFSTADEGDLSYALEQESKFKLILNLTKTLGYKFENIHFSNSGAILNLNHDYSNIVRVGMLLYGAYPSDELAKTLPVKPVMCFKAPIVSVRTVPENTHISYGGVYKTKARTNIAVIQCGFADGLPRPWFKNGYINYKGKQYNIAGRICMDMFMVDFGDIFPNVNDEVLLIGKDDINEIRLETIANSIKSTPYVLVTAIGGRTERIYQG